MTTRKKPLPKRPKIYQKFEFAEFIELCVIELLVFTHYRLEQTIKIYSMKKGDPFGCTLFLFYSTYNVF